MKTGKYYWRMTAFIAALLIISVMGYAQKIEDSEIKKNIAVIDNPLQRLLQLEPKIFEYDKGKYKDLRLPPGKQYGFLSDNLQNVFPELVTYRNYNYMTGKNSFRTAKLKEAAMTGIIPVLVASIQEQQSEIEKLRAEVQELKNKSSTAVK